MDKIRNLRGELTSSHELLLDILDNVYNGESITDNYEYLYKLAVQNKLLLQSRDYEMD